MHAWYWCFDCLAWFQVNSTRIMLKICMAHCYCWNCLKCFNNNGTHQFSLWYFFLRWPSFIMNWVESSIVITKSHLFFIASFMKSLSDSGSPMSHTLHWWLFSWHRSVPWCAQFPTLLDSFDSLLGKEHSHFEEDCIPDSESSTCYMHIWSIQTEYPL